VGNADDQNAVLYTYTPVGKRDPFRNPTLTTGTLRPVGPAKPGQALTPLQKFEIDQLKVQFTMTGTSSPTAMVLDPNAKGHLVHIGDFIGRNWGKISHIGREEMTVTETIADQQTGRVYPVYIPMRMPKTDQEKRQEQELEESSGSKNP
jgi:type IV pilus assembly protein PilP